MDAMTEANTQKSKAKETPKFEAPKFDIPTFEVPAAFREFAEKGLPQAKENYEKVNTIAEDTTDAIERAGSLDDRALFLGGRPTPDAPREEASEQLRDRLLLAAPLLAEGDDGADEL